MALSQITAKTKITASTLNTVIDAVNSIQTATPQRYVAAFWSSGSSWVRTWNDGFIEQGGKFNPGSSGTMSFHTPFSNTDYKMLMIATQGLRKLVWTPSTTGVQYVQYATFNGASDDSSDNADWYACRILTFHSKRTQFSEKEIAQNERIFYWSNFFGRIPS